MAHFMDQRRSDPATNHSLPRHAYDCHRIVASSRQARSSSSNGCSVTAIEVTDQTWQAVVITGERQRVGGNDVQSRQPDSDSLLAALRHYRSKYVQLR